MFTTITNTSGSGGVHSSGAPLGGHSTATQTLASTNSVTNTGHAAAVTGAAMAEGQAGSNETDVTATSVSATGGAGSGGGRATASNVQAGLTLTTDGALADSGSATSQGLAAITGITNSALGSVSSGPTGIGGTATATQTIGNSNTVTNTGDSSAMTGMAEAIGQAGDNMTLLGVGTVSATGGAGGTGSSSTGDGMGGTGTTGPLWPTLPFSNTVPTGTTGSMGTWTLPEPMGVPGALDGMPATSGMNTTTSLLGGGSASAMQSVSNSSTVANSGTSSVMTGPAMSWGQVGSNLTGLTIVGVNAVGGANGGTAGADNGQLGSSTTWDWAAAYGGAATSQGDSAITGIGNSSPGVVTAGITSKGSGGKS
ncbi:MAG: hypothetical protein ACRDHX_05955 [Chloroflexota bacterium]